VLFNILRLASRGFGASLVPPLLSASAQLPLTHECEHERERECVSGGMPLPAMRGRLIARTSRGVWHGDELSVWWS